MAQGVTVFSSVAEAIRCGWEVFERKANGECLVRRGFESKDGKLVFALAIVVPKGNAR